ncbi:von Willebrand factor A domain-containing protein 5A [Exaiptasia diaphana]|uniref:von Willebrand factor A domain-containing protein 5A n=1 Tax=Exaiptasia diaphana TaxID=2652724 RepID=A0A913XKD6_EXADI|nr:von Willebrand factor A domain-containing protein 5A [Exaiptasia diaphana]KXJ25777.1 von Willebrand factor A domain-containing protein 5A [Exaiptasia diaphana]
MASFGLINKANSSCIPIKSISISSKLHGFTAQVTAAMEFTNDGNNPVEVMYVFPLDEEASVCDFQATIDGRTIVAEIQDKQEARNTYDDAISSGFSAFHLEESDESSDVFQINVGNLPPRVTATIKLTFVTTLKVEREGRVVFMLPTVLNPRYSPSGSNVSSKMASLGSMSKLYSFYFEMNVHCASPIIKITSSHYQLTVDINPDDNRQATVRLDNNHRYDNDLEVHVLCQQPFQPHTLVENGVTKSTTGIPNPFLSKPVVMLNFFPEFDRNATLERGEFIFVVDQSGSMAGSKMKSARESLLLFLKSLPENCYFNVVGFGSSFNKLFDRSEFYNDSTLSHACGYGEVMEANLGGTEILDPLRDVFSQPVIKGYPRQIFLLTDGEVSNTQQVIELVRANSTNARCFTFGIGEGASSHLVKGVARAGLGTAEFVSARDRLQTKVMKTLKNAFQPAVKDVSLTWNLPKTWTAETVPVVNPTVFHGNQLVMFGLLSRKDVPSRTSITAIEGTVTLTGYIDDGQHLSLIRHVLKFSAVCGNPAESSLLLHRLCAKASILEQDDDGHVIQLSKSANIISRLTSFVGVDKHTGVVVSRPFQPQAVLPMNSGTMFGFYGNIGGGLPTVPGGVGFGGPTQPQSMNMAQRFSYGNTGGNLLGGPPRAPSSSSNMGKAPLLPGSTNYSPPRVPPRQSSSKLLGLKMMDKESSPSYRNTQTYLSLIALQTASGAWQPTDKLATVCGKTLSEIRKSCPPELYQNNKDILWATAVALAYLTATFPDQQDEWGIAADKAMKWLKTNLPRDSFENIMHLASRCIFKR